jgi:hypothetical protein
MQDILFILICQKVVTIMNECVTLFLSYFICNNVSLAVMTYFVSLKIRFMKNVFSQYSSFALISCEEDVRFNNLRFKGKDNVFWSCRVTASLGPNGSLVIEAYTGNEVIR